MSCVGKHHEEKESTVTEAGPLLIRCCVPRTWEEVKGAGAPGRGTARVETASRGCLESKEALAACSGREVRRMSSEGFEPGI